MKPAYTTLYILILLIISSCQKDLSEQELLYQGKWESADYTLFIFSNGKGSCIHKKLSLRCNGAVNVTNRKIVFTSNSSDAHIFRVKFNIDQQPEIDNEGVKYMILNGERFEQ